jgi:hypothetical protein
MMRLPGPRSTRLPLALGLLLLAAGPVLAHGSGARIEVQPDTVTAGGTVTLVGENLEPKNERVVLLVGADMRLELGSVTTDAEGMFSLQVAIPAHLPGGVYEFQAIGDETLTVQLNVIGAAGPSTGGQSGLPEPAPRERSPLELALWLAIAAASLGVGVLLVIRAERFGGHPGASD